MVSRGVTVHISWQKALSSWKLISVVTKVNHLVILNGAHLFAYIKYPLKWIIKAALINIFILTTNKWLHVMWKVLLVVMNLQRIITFPQLCVLASFRLLFWFYSPQILLSSTLFPDAAGSCFQWKNSDKLTINHLLSTTQQTKLATSW